MFSQWTTINFKVLMLFFSQVGHGRIRRHIYHSSSIRGLQNRLLHNNKELFSFDDEMDNRV